MTITSKNNLIKMKKGGNELNNMLNGSEDEAGIKNPKGRRFHTPFAEKI